MAKRNLIVLFSFCLICLRTAFCQVETTDKWNGDKFKEEASQTFNLVFHKYNHRVRPPQLFIEINSSIALRHIRYLDRQKQELQTVLDVFMNWTDSRLQWYPDKVLQIHVNTSTVWTPDIVYTNSVADTRVLYPSTVLITNKGQVTWSKKEVVTTYCPTQLDSLTQNCSIFIGFLSNSVTEQTDRFFSNQSSFSFNDVTNHDWEVKVGEMVIEVGNVTKRVSSLEILLILEQQTQATDSQPVPGKINEDHSHKTSSANCEDELTGSSGAFQFLLFVNTLGLIWFVTAVNPLLRLFFQFR